MVATVLGFLVLFVGLVLMGWILTFTRVKMGFVKCGQEAIEEYFDSVKFALLMTGFIFLLSLESWIG